MKCTFVVEHDVGSVRLPSPFLDVVVDSKLNSRNYRFDLDRNFGKFILGLSTPSSTPHQLVCRLGRSPERTSCQMGSGSTDFQTDR